MDFSGIRERHLKQTVRNIQTSFRRDELLLECVSALSELDVVINGLATKLRHWTENFFPELCRNTNSELLSARLMDSPETLRQMNSMGAEINADDFAALRMLADIVLVTCKKKKELEVYLNSLAAAVSPSMTALVGPVLAARLIAEAKSLKKLAMLPASTIQVLGAGEAMLKHLMTNAKPPKHGLIFSHPLVNKAPRAERGKRARALADKIAIAARVDYFGGKEIGKQLLKKLEARFR